MVGSIFASLPPGIELSFDHQVFVDNRLVEHFSVSHGLGDILMAQHPAQIFYLDAVGQHPRGKGVAGQVGVERERRLGEHADGF